jgi:cobalt-zinc-cadmium efflux system membrane fusion protein
MTRFITPNKNRLIILLVPIALIVAIAVWVFTTSRTHGAAASEPAARPASSTTPGTFKLTASQWDALTTAAVSAIPFRSELTTDGNIATDDNLMVNVFSPYSGRVANGTAKLGDTVKKGDPLMTVDASEFVQGQNDLITAAGAFNTASTQLRLAQKTENRQHELLLAKAGAEKDWLQSQSDLTAAQNTVKSTEIALSAVRNRLRILGKTDAEINALEHTPDSQKLGATATVKAPIGGVVVQRQVGVGQYIQSASGGASTPMFGIADLSSVWLIANLREPDAAAVKVGQTVEVKVPAYPSRIFEAKLTWISPIVDPVSHRIPVRAEITNRDRALKPQMLASFKVITGEASELIAIPLSAVVYEGSSAHVFVAQADHTIASRTIVIERQNNDAVGVRTGLSVGEKIVTSGALFIDRAAKSAAE